MSRTQRIRSFVVKFALSVLLFFALGEVLARQLSFIDRMNAFPRELYTSTATADLPYALRPGIRISRQSRDGEYEVRVNRLGFRGAEVAELPATGVQRVLVLGDSVAFGEGLAEVDTFPVLLESDLNAGRNHAYEVINAGVSGFNTAAEAALLRERGLPLQPSAIVLAVSFNDFGPAPVITPAGVLSAAQAVQRRTNWLSDHSEFVILLRWLVTYAKGEHPFQIMAAAATREGSDEQIWERIDAAVAKRHQQFYRNPRGPDWDRVRSALVEIRDLAAANGARLLVVLFPEQFQVTETTGPHKGVPTELLSPQRAWLRLCRALDLDCLDLHSAFQAASERDLFMDMQHPNAAGHRVAARATAVALRRRAAVPSTTTGEDSHLSNKPDY